MKSHAVPLLLDVQGSPYLVEPEMIEPGENIYPELAPNWDGAPQVVEVEDGETLTICGRRYQVNQCGGLELVALAMPGDSEYLDPGTCAACGAPMDDGDPLRAFCPNGPHTLDD